jgi:hypothetical protein
MVWPISAIKEWLFLRKLKRSGWDITGFKHVESFPGSVGCVRVDHVEHREYSVFIKGALLSGEIKKGWFLYVPTSFAFVRALPWITWHIGEFQFTENDSDFHLELDLEDDRSADKFPLDCCQPELWTGRTYFVVKEPI